MASWAIRRATRWARGGVTLVLVAGLGISGAGFAGQAAARSAVRHWRPEPQKVKVLPRVPLKVAVRRDTLPKVPEGTSKASRWPAAGTASVTFARPWRMVRAGSLPVLAAAAGPSGARVRVFGQAQARKLGISGVVFKVSVPGG